MSIAKFDHSGLNQQQKFEVLPDKWVPSPLEFPAPFKPFEQQTVEGLPITLEGRLLNSPVPLSRHSAVFYYGNEKEKKKGFIREDQKLRFSSFAYLDWVSWNQKLVFRNIKTNKIVIVTAKKRGNEGYAKKVYSKFSFRKGGTFEHYLKAHDYHGLRIHAFVDTLTYPDSKGSKSYEDVGTDWNRFQSNLKKKYGKIRFVRVWEAMKNGVAHVHALIFLEGKAPVGFRGRDGLPKFDKKDFNYIKKAWPYNSRIEPAVSLVRAYWYILKYLFKSLSPQEYNYYHSILERYFNGEELTKTEEGDLKAVLTNSQIWIHNKQGYAVSKDIRDMLENDSILIQEKTNSNHEWELLGVIDDYLYRIPDGAYSQNAKILEKMLICEGWKDT